MSIPGGGGSGLKGFILFRTNGGHEFWANYLCYSLLKKGLLIRNYSAGSPINRSLRRRRPPFVDPPLVSANHGDEAAAAVRFYIRGRRVHEGLPQAVLVGPRRRRPEEGQEEEKEQAQCPRGGRGAHRRRGPRLAEARADRG